MSDRITFLRSPEAFRLREEHRAPPGTPPPDALRLISALRKQRSDDEARALAEQIVLERRAHEKFDDPTRLLFDRLALEQASSRGVAAYHAALAPDGARVVDLGCGIGADTMAFARAGAIVTGVDHDATRAAFTAHNLATLGERALAVVGNATALPARGDVLFVDPDRRTKRGRSTRLDELQPDWCEISAAARRFARVLVKAPPAVPDADLPSEGEVRFLSESGDCKEALLVLGDGARAGARAAVLVDEGLARSTDPGPRVESAETGRYLFDPDPALRRAGGVDGLARELGACRAAPRSTYLLADEPIASPWLRGYEVIDAFPYRHRDLVRRLRDDPPSEIVVKQRAAGVPESSVRRGLPIHAGGPRVVIVLLARGRSTVAVRCRPL